MAGQELVAPVVIIGYGNSLRGDDALGPQVAAAVAARPGVRAVVVPQLTPELAEPIAAARAVIFVDAESAEPGAAVRVQPVLPRGDADGIGHTSDPRALLALTEALYGVRTPAWLVAVPGVNFALGEGLSPAAADGLKDAVARVGQLLERELAGSS